VLLFAARHGCADIEAIQDAYFGAWRSPAQRCLAHLFESGYVNKLRGRALNECDVYYVSPSAKRGYALAEEMLAAEGTKPAPLPPRVKLEEMLGLTRLAARFLRACREGGLFFREWRSERELRPVAALEQLVPDAYLRIARGEAPDAKAGSFFVEWETSDKPTSYWDRKFLRYVDLFDSGRYERGFRTNSLRILVVVAGDRQAAGRLRRLSAAADRAQATMVRLALWQDLRAAPAADVLRAPLWTQPGRDERLSLFRTEEA
jgi:hypothetical protein